MKKNEILHLRVHPALKEKIRNESMKLGVSMSDYVRQAVTSYYLLPDDMKRII